MNLFVVDDPKDWQLENEDLNVISAEQYLTDSQYSKKQMKVFNLCKLQYQKDGYYVSLLADARNHRPIPSIETIKGMNVAHIIKTASTDLDEYIQKALSHIKTKKFELSVYFAKNIAKRYDLLSRKLYAHFPCPLFRAYFTKRKDKWVLTNIKSLSTTEIPDENWEFLESCVTEYFKKKITPATYKGGKYDLAILYNKDDPESPSNERAIKNFVKAANKVGFNVEVISKDDYGRLAEFDALFMREVTYVNRHTYSFSRKAEREGLVVIDDPQTIVRCTNKVYLAECLTANGIPTPKTIIIHKKRCRPEDLIEEIGLPIVLKQPDSSFSLGVKKAKTKDELTDLLRKMFEKSDMVIAQEYLPTEFDWRIGVLNGKALYACKYYMPKGHWQIIQWREGKKPLEGKDEPIPLRKVPRKVIKYATKAAQTIGDGLYGVDLKQIKNDVYVVEVNDNPNIDAGYEDKLLGDSLYTMIMQEFFRRLNKRR